MVLVRAVLTMVMRSSCVAVVLLAHPIALAHCDTLDGPVVRDARSALQKGDVTPVLKWVGKGSEEKIRQAFDKALRDRAGNDSERKRADTRFFETLVRVHRSGEGETFTGLKPAGTTDPSLIAADKALEEGSVTALSEEIAGSVREQLHRRFTEVLAKKKHANDSIEAGRDYVAAYVAYAHYVEAIHALNSSRSEQHRHLHAADEHGNKPHTESSAEEDKP